MRYKPEQTQGPRLLRYLRVSSGESQSQVGDAVGVSQPVICCVERMGIASERVRHRLEAYYNCAFAELVAVVIVDKEGVCHEQLTPCT